MIGDFPFGAPGHVCETRRMEGGQWKLPRGLAPGVRVRTVEADGDYWWVELEGSKKLGRWRVHLMLLTVLEYSPNPNGQRPE